MIAVTFALPVESSDLVFLLQSKQQTRAGESNIIRGEIGTRSVAIIHTGVGQRTCEARMKDYLGREHPRFLISSGFAGGINTELNAGDLFLGKISPIRNCFRPRNDSLVINRYALVNCLRLRPSSIPRHKDQKLRRRTMRTPSIWKRK